MSGATGTVGDSRPFYQRASFWLGPFMWMLGVSLAVLLGVGWYILGGLPRDHDEYATVPVPGLATVELPEGDIRLNFENDVVGGGDTRSIADQPDGLAVAVTPAGGGDQLAVDDVPSWIFSSIVEDRGHEPWGKVDIPEEGEYVIRTADDASGGIDAEPPPGEADDAGPEITVGEGPWTPGDSKLLGAILCGIAVMALVLLLTLPFRIFVKD